MPVTVVFTISLSLIFLSSLTQVNSESGENIFKVLGFTAEGNSLKYEGIEGAPISFSADKDGLDFLSMGDFFSLLFKTGI